MPEKVRTKPRVHRVAVVTKCGGRPIEYVTILSLPQQLLDQLAETTAKLVKLRQEQTLPLSLDCATVRCDDDLADVFAYTRFSKVMDATCDDLWEEQWEDFDYCRVPLRAMKRLKEHCADDVILHPQVDTPALTLNVPLAISGTWYAFRWEGTDRHNGVKYETEWLDVRDFEPPR